MKEDKERPRSQAKTKPVVETDAEKPIEPKTDDGNTHNNPNPLSVPPT